MQEQPLALVVNAGGQSRRMGRAKALLPVPPSGAPLFLHIVRRLLPLVTGGVVVVANDPFVVATVEEFANEPVNESQKITVLPDGWPAGGALGGLATGLSVCAGWAMVVACDMPLVDAGIFARLASVACSHPEYDAVIPNVAGHAQPFHGLWHRRALAVLVGQLAAGELAVHKALALLNVAWMDEHALGIGDDCLAFYNVNTPQEWDALQAILHDL
jgi:molybdenum cofactor guanylyltransferase